MEHVKKIAGILVFALLLAGCNNSKSTSGSETGSDASEAQWVEVTLSVDGMTCEGCEQAIKLGVESLEGVASAESSFEEAWTKVRYDEEVTSLEEIESKIAETGYEVKGEMEDSNL